MGNRFRTVEMGHEILCMDPRVGSSTAHGFNGLIADLTQRFVDFTLYGHRIVLNLPAPEMGAFVGQFNGIAHDYKFS